VIDNATLTASPATTGTDGAVTNVKDWKPWSFWLPTGSAPWTLEANLGGTYTVNSVAIYGHDCDDTVGVDQWNGAAWVEVVTTEADGSGDTLYLTFDAVSTTKLRFRFDQLTYLAILYAGEDVRLPEGLAPGWSDPVLAQRAKLEHEVSRGAVHLGSRVDFFDASLTLTLKEVEATWVRDEWLPFLRVCSSRPFFLQWHETDWPNSAILCTSPDFGNSAFSQVGFCDVSVGFSADRGRAAP
jgi:hypothetical protein